MVVVAVVVVSVRHDERVRQFSQISRPDLDVTRSASMTVPLLFNTLLQVWPRLQKALIPIHCSSYFQANNKTLSIHVIHNALHTLSFYFVTFSVQYVLIELAWQTLQ